MTAKIDRPKARREMSSYGVRYWCAVGAGFVMAGLDPAIHENANLIWLSI